MSDNRKYYYLKLKDDFFDSDALTLLETMDDGYLYSNILLKLYLRSLKNDGKLMFNDTIPYNPKMLAHVTRHTVGNIKEALKIFEQLDLIEILDSGAIYMLDIQNFVGTSSTEADRKRAYRRRIEEERTNVPQIEDKCLDKSPPEIREERLENRDKRIEERGEKLTHSSLIEINNLWNEVKKQDIDLFVYKNRVDLIAEKYGIENIKKAINQIKNSEYLQRKDVCSITWFLTEEKFTKILAGDYGDFKKEDTTKATKFHNFEENKHSEEEINKLWEK